VKTVSARTEEALAGVGGVPWVIESPRKTTRSTSVMSWWLVPAQWLPTTGRN